MAELVQESILSGRTLNISDLNEVILLLQRYQYNKASYYQLGLCLLLSDNTLRAIEQENRGQVDRCFRECLVRWLRKADCVENPTIDTLIAALRGIEENAVADGINGEKQIHYLPRNEEGRPTTTPTLEINEGAKEMEALMDRLSILKPITYSLRQKYIYLVVAVRRSLRDHGAKLEDAKLLLKECFKDKAREHPQLKEVTDSLQKVQDFNNLFDFLSDHHFIGYLNYNLLKSLSKLIPHDDDLMNQVDDYEKKYAELLHQISCNELVHLFDQWPDLSPTAPVGLPFVSFRLDSPWLPYRFYTWVLTLGKFSWSYYAFLKQLRKNCVIVTYAILPCVVDDVMRDLKDPVILKELKDKGITVIELPQEEEVPQIESTTKIEPISIVDAEESSSVIQTTSSEGNIPTTSTTTLTSEANIPQEVPLFKQKEAAPIEKEATIKSSNLGRELIRSIESDTKPEEIIGLLEAGADPNATEYPSGGDPALIKAIERDNIGIVELLLEKGADPNIVYDTYGCTPLHCASKNGNSQIVELLISKGNADVNVMDMWGNPPFFDAFNSGNTKVVDILLNNGARTGVVNTRVDFEESMQTTSSEGNIPTTSTTTLGRELIRSIESDTKPEEVIGLLEAGADPNVTEYSSSGYTALIISIEKDNTDIIKLLLEKGADPEYMCDGNIALIKAIERDNIGIVELLLEKGADPNIVYDTYSCTPLHYATKTGNSQIIELLITKGNADVNVLDEWNSTPLFDAVNSGSIEVVDILLTNGARTDVVDRFGDTPLLLAVKRRELNIISLLITKGQADVTTVCKKYHINPIGLSGSEIANLLIIMSKSHHPMLSSPEALMSMDCYDEMSSEPGSPVTAKRTKLTPSEEELDITLRKVL